MEAEQENRKQKHATTHKPRKTKRKPKSKVKQKKVRAEPKHSGAKQDGPANGAKLRVLAAQASGPPKRVRHTVRVPHPAFEDVVGGVREGGRHRIDRRSV